MADKYGGELANPQRVSNYKEYDSEFADYRKSMELTDIKSFERREHISRASMQLQNVQGYQSCN